MGFFGCAEQGQYQHFKHKHIAQDFMLHLGITAIGYEVFGGKTEGMDEKGLQRFWEKLGGNPDTAITSDARIESNETILLAKNVMLAMQAYLDLGSDKPLSHAETVTAVERFKSLPAVLAQAEKYLKDEKDMYVKMENMEEALRSVQFESYAHTLNAIVSSVIKQMEGEGRGKGKPDKNG